MLVLWIGEFILGDLNICKAERRGWLGEVLECRPSLGGRLICSLSDRLGTRRAESHTMGGRKEILLSGKLLVLRAWLLSDRL